MNITKEEAFQKIKQLTERFTEHIDEYKRIGSKEHQTKVDYINPLLFFFTQGQQIQRAIEHAEKRIDELVTSLMGSQTRRWRLLKIIK